MKKIICWVIKVVLQKFFELVLPGLDPKVKVSPNNVTVVEVGNEIKVSIPGIDFSLSLTCTQGTRITVKMVWDGIYKELARYWWVLVGAGLAFYGFASLLEDIFTFLLRA